MSAHHPTRWGQMMPPLIPYADVLIWIHMPHNALTSTEVSSQTKVILSAQTPSSSLRCGQEGRTSAQRIERVDGTWPDGVHPP
jgi:hypothetical protein